MSILYIDRDDPYSWLEDLENSRTREFIRRHNERLARYLGELPRELIHSVEEYLGTPYLTVFKPCQKGVYYVVRSREGYSVEFIDWSGDREVLLKSSDLGRDVVIPPALYPNRECSLLGIPYSFGGSDEGFISIIDTSSREEVDKISGVVGNIVWLDSYKYYYARFYRRDRTPDGVEAPAERIFLRDYSSGDELLVFGENLPTNYLVELYDKVVDDYILVGVYYGWSRSKIYYGAKNRPSSWRLLLDGGEYIVKPAGFLGGEPILVVYDGEGLGRIVKCRQSSRVEEVVPETNYPLIEALAVDDKIVAVYLVDASSRLKIYNNRGEIVYEYKPGEPSTINTLEYMNREVFFREESFSHPPQLNKLALDSTRLQTLYTPSTKLDLEVDEEWTTSWDGTRIHFFIVEMKNKPKNKTAIVYGYGGFSISITPTYIASTAVLLEKGYTYVVANLRGGSEYGEKWHRAGMRENKQNVFEDYKAVLKYFKQKGYRVVARGSSNGGLLVAATMTQNPDLVDIAVIGYPVIDMLKFHKLYIGRLWTTEYGDPDNPSDRKYLVKYSPYHNIKRGETYPPTLVYTGLHDDRVHPAHALKFVARLEEETNTPVYLRVETSSGHRGADTKIIAREHADIIAFIHKTIDNLNKKQL